MNLAELGPDEKIYWRQGQMVRERGPFEGLRALCERFQSDPDAKLFPSPLRWLWIWLTAIVSPVSRNGLAFLSAIAMGPTVAWAVAPLGLSPWAFLLASSSPLLWCLSRRMLQDCTVALAVVVSLGTALHGSPVWFAVSLFVLLSLKEVAVLFVPGLTLAAAATMPTVAEALCATAIGCSSAALAMRAIVGRETFRVFRLAPQASQNGYTQLYQRGAPHRLVIDLVMVSPLTTVWFLASDPPLSITAFVAVTLAAHAFAPARNVRFILALDIAMRAAVAGYLGVWSLPLFAADALLFLKLLDVYDPVSHVLTKAFEMAPKES